MHFRWNGIQGSNLFYGRDAELGLANEYLRSSNDQPMIFYGEHGCGKTSILARIATEARKWLIAHSKQQDDQVSLINEATLNSDSVYA